MRGPARPKGVCVCCRREMRGPARPKGMCLL